MEVFDKLEKLKEYCKERNVPLTQQRVEVYRTLVETDQHPSPENIYKHLKNNYPTLSLATVYKNLEALTKIGFIQLINPLSNQARYDGDISAHNHFVCLSCKKVEDIDSDAINDLKIPDWDNTEHEILTKTIIFTGICKQCKNNTLEEK